MTIECVKTHYSHTKAEWNRLYAIYETAYNMVLLEKGITKTELFWRYKYSHPQSLARFLKRNRIHEVEQDPRVMYHLKPLRLVQKMNARLFKGMCDLEWANL